MLREVSSEWRSRRQGSVVLRRWWRHGQASMQKAAHPLQRWSQASGRLMQLAPHVHRRPCSPLTSAKSMAANTLWVDSNPTHTVGQPQAVRAAETQACHLWRSCPQRRLSRSELLSHAPSCAPLSPARVQTPGSAARCWAQSMEESKRASANVTCTALPSPAQARASPPQASRLQQERALVAREGTAVHPVNMHFPALIGSKSQMLRASADKAPIFHSHKALTQKEEWAHKKQQAWAWQLQAFLKSLCSTLHCFQTPQSHACATSPPSRSWTLQRSTPGQQSCAHLAWWMETLHPCTPSRFLLAKAPGPPLRAPPPAAGYMHTASTGPGVPAAQLEMRFHECSTGRMAQQPKLSRGAAL